MTRTPLIAGNWKMNLGASEAVALGRAVAAAAHDTCVEVAVFPPFPWLVPVREALTGSNVRLGAQNCHTRASGAFTGEVAAAMLTGLCDYVLAGHSERRHVFGESDSIVGEKVAAITAAGIEPVLCVGETYDERNTSQAESVVARQLQSVVTNELIRFTIAYEPVWAIGTGVAATAQDAQDMCAFIRGWLREVRGAGSAEIRILYGGSVTPANAVELLSQPDIDGALVGGASLKSDTFLEIVSAAAR